MFFFLDLMFLEQLWKSQVFWLFTYVYISFQKFTGKDKKDVKSNNF